jgi:hypothetical protein
VRQENRTDYTRRKRLTQTATNYSEKRIENAKKNAKLRFHISLFISFIFFFLFPLSRFFAFFLSRFSRLKTTKRANVKLIFGFVFLGSFLIYCRVFVVLSLLLVLLGYVFLVFLQLFLLFQQICLGNLFYFVSRRVAVGLLQLPRNF